MRPKRFAGVGLSLEQGADPHHICCLLLQIRNQPWLLVAKKVRPCSGSFGLWRPARPCCECRLCLWRCCCGAMPLVRGEKAAGNQKEQSHALLPFSSSLLTTPMGTTIVDGGLSLDRQRGLLDAQCSLLFSVLDLL